MTITNANIEDYISLLREADDLYFNTGTSDLSDVEYDKLKKTAYAMDKSHPYFRMVGSDVRGGKVKLPYTMGSLNQIYDGEYSGWVSKYDVANEKLVSTHKLDGVSCMLVYYAGELSIAFSRGNGVEGADVTRHVKLLNKTPLKLTSPVDYLVVRGEVIMRNSTFSEGYAEEFKNPRNMVAGCMNRKETDASILKDIDLIVYEIVDSSKDVTYTSKTEMLKLLSKLGFEVVQIASTDVANLLNEKSLEKILIGAKAKSDYELDGIVVTVDEFKDLDSKSSSSSLNPEHSFKFKVNEESSIVETYVKDVVYEISKNGFLKPVVEIYPVELFGTTVKRATGFNAGFIKARGIGRGAKIRITKSGSVIPYIHAVVESVEPLLPDKNYIPWEFNASGVEAVVSDPNNQIVLFKQVLDFFETLKIELLKEASLKKVWEMFISPDGNTDYDQIIYNLLSLTEFEWKQAIGENGSKIYESLTKRTESLPLATFLGAVTYMGFGFGVRKAKMLLTALSDNNAVWNLTESQVTMFEGFDSKTASMIIAGLPKAKKLLDKLDGLIRIVDEVSTSELKGVIVVMTGFRDSDLHEKIERQGGKVGSSVSKKTTHLLAMDPNSGSSKLESARKLGVKVMSPDDFKLEFDL